MPIHVYAEHLVNINALRVQVNLPTPSGLSTTARLSPGGSELHIEHDGEESCTRLPARVVGKQQTLAIPSQPAKLLSYRFSLPAADAVSAEVESRANTIPWTAADLSATTAVHCAACSALVLPRGYISEWKDLPTEGWAEMMEFWHCHKPAEPDTTDQPQKGYSAASRLHIQQGVGLVAATIMLFAPADLPHVKVGLHDLHCACKAVLGVADEQAYRLYKHALAISAQGDASPRSFALEKWQACMLLTATEAQGVSKFITTDRDSAEAASIWIFAPDMCVSSTSAATTAPLHVVKVMFKSLDSHTSTNGQRLNRETAGTGDIELTKSERELLVKSLQSCSLILPEEMRKFQDWTVSLLPRFTAQDLR